MRIDWRFLDTFNQTAFKGWSAGWLWIYTGAVWGVVAGIAAWRNTNPPTEWLVGWLAGLAAYSGVSAYQYKTMRVSDYGALDRQAAIEAAKVTQPGETP